MPKDTVKSEYVLEVFSEGIQGDHIESQVGHIGMNKTVTDKPVILPTLDSWRIEDEIVNNLLLRKATDGSNTGYNDYYKGDA